jgi:hypothetical protein
MSVHDVTASWVCKFKPEARKSEHVVPEEKPRVQVMSLAWSCMYLNPKK